VDERSAGKLGEPSPMSWSSIGREPARRAPLALTRRTPIGFELLEGGQHHTPWRATQRPQSLHSKVR
jgi:hypothetical protein